MAVPNKAKLSQVQEEFGAPLTAPLSDFYRGGDYVPDTTTNAGVPTSGEILLSDLDGAAAYTGMTLVLSGDTEPNGACSAVGTSCTANTDPITCTVSDGTGPFVFTTEKKTGETTFATAKQLVSDRSSSFEYSSTNGNATETISSEYRIKVVDATGAEEYTAYFDVSNVHTFVESSLSEMEIGGSSTLSSYFTNNASPANGQASTNYSVSGGGSGPYELSMEVIVGSAFNSATLSPKRITDDGFTLDLYCASSVGFTTNGSWNGTWEIRITATRNGKSAYKDVWISVGGVG